VFNSININLLGNIKKNLYLLLLLLLIFVSFEELFYFAKTNFCYFSTIEYICWYL